VQTWESPRNTVTITALQFAFGGFEQTELVMNARCSETQLCGVECAVELIVAAAVDAVVCCVQSVSIHLFANTEEPLD